MLHLQVLLTDLGATAPRRHSSSRDGSTAGLLAAVRIMFKAMPQDFSCLSKYIAETPPNDIVSFMTLIAWSIKGSSISRMKSNLCLTSWKYAQDACSGSSKTITLKISGKERWGYSVFCENIIHISRYGQYNILQSCTRTGKRLPNSLTNTIKKSNRLIITWIWKTVSNLTKPIIDVDSGWCK